MYNIHCISMSHGLYYPVRYTCIITTINHTLCIDDSASLVIPMTSMLLIDTGISQYVINTLVTCSHVIAIYRYQ